MYIVNDPVLDHLLCMEDDALTPEREAEWEAYQETGRQNARRQVMLERAWKNGAVVDWDKGIVLR